MGVTLLALRGRLPLVAFILLAVVCFAVLGFACACLTDHPMQALERALGSIPALPALVVVWPLFALAALGSAFVFAGRTDARARAPSAAALQRFLL